MIRYQIYPAYKYSGVGCLGDVPEHWKIIPVKFSLDMPITDGPHSTPQFYKEGIPFLSAEAVKNDNLDFNRKRGCITEEDHLLFSKKCKPKYGDVFMVKSGATTGSVARVLTHEEFNIWSPLAVLRPHPCRSLSDYIFYVLKSKPFFYAVELYWSYGTQQNIGMGVISNIRMALPPLKEQEAITRFLNYKTGQIDALIAKKEALLAKLAEKRTALISHAVTKGLDPSVPMKDSGVAWLGEIPAHWTAVRIRHISEFVTSGSRGWAEFYSNEGSVFLRITNVSRVSIQPLLEDIQRVSPPDSAEGKRTATKGGDVIISITADLGSVSVIPDGYEPAFVSQHLALVRPITDRVVGQWMAYQVFSSVGQAQLLGAGYGGTKIQLSLTDIKDMWMALPPVEEQNEICSYLGGTLVRLNQQISGIRNVMGRLLEYRAALITNAVTGKIDVRQFALPITEQEAAHA